MKDNSIINEIILKVFTGEELTSTERTMYEEFVTDDANRELVERLNNGDYQRQVLKDYHAIDVAGGKAIIDRKLNGNYGKLIDIQQKPKRKIFRDVATSAAAVLVILSAAIFLWRYTNRDKTIEAKETIKVAAKKVIGPAQRMASLTLADGSTIMLDSSKVGQLTRQGRAMVVNENGTVKYQANTEEQEVLYNKLTTAYAQTYAMELADGTKAWLNAGASIKYPVEFTGNERRVEISGEVYFEVAHNVNKPFIVHVTGRKGPMDVQVLGTHFNINAYDDEAVIKTTLLEGSVKVSNIQKVEGRKDSVVLKPGEQAILSQLFQTSQGISVQTVNVEAVVAWKNGAFSFENADIDMVMRQLEKWYDITVEYAGTKPSDKISGGMQRNWTLPEVVKSLEFITGLHFRIEGRKLIVPAALPDNYRKSNK
jgi:ferric-dicitrate binding protein FerR (iron transport regulator)